jgi:hypothetical protein
MNQAHEQIAGVRSIQRLVEERIPAIENRFLESSFDDVMPRARLCRADDFAKLPACILMVADAA